MSNKFDLVKKLESETNFKFSKLFKVTMATVSILSAILFMFIAACKMAEYQNVVIFLLKTLAVLWMSVFFVFLYDVLRYLKHKWDMRTVAVTGAVNGPKLTGGAFPQNAIYAKRDGLKFRKPTKEERIKWGLNKKKIPKDIPFLAEDENDNIKLNNPELSDKEYSRIRKEQKRRNKIT